MLANYEFEIVCDAQHTDEIKYDPQYTNSECETDILWGFINFTHFYRLFYHKFCHLFFTFFPLIRHDVRIVLTLSIHDFVYLFKRLCPCKFSLLHMSLPPFRILPTEQLRPEKRLKSTNIPSVSQSSNDIDLVEIPQQEQTRVKYRPLEEEDGKAILNFVYNRPKDNNNNNQEKIMNTSSKLRNTQKGLVFEGSGDTRDEKQNTTILSMIAEKTKFITMENIKKIDKKFLLSNKVTIKNLIEDCHVSPIKLKYARILTTFEDLIDLDFQLTDLTIGDRRLFNADKLVTFFNADYRYMRDHKRFSFSVAEIKEVNFYPTELSTLGFDFSELVDEKMINRQDLRELNFTFEGFKLLGLTRQHAVSLSISKNFALTKLKWTVEECDVFDLDNMKGKKRNK